MGLSFAIRQMSLRYAPALFLVGLGFTMAGALFAWFRRKHRALANGSDRRRVLTITLKAAGIMGTIFVSSKIIPAGESATLTFARPLFVVVGGRCRSAIACFAIRASRCQRAAT